MRAGYDTAPVALNTAGERRYALSLLRALRAREDVEVVPITLSRRVPRTFAQRLVWQAAAEGLYYPLLIGRRARAAGVDVLHHPRHLVPPEAGLTVPSVVTVHDVLALRMPQYFSQLIARRYRVLAKLATARAARVITGSESSRADIVELLGVPEERVRVTPYAVESHFRPVEPDRERLGVPGPYVLCVGTLEPRKNLAGAVRAFERIQSEFPDHALVIIGGRGWKGGELERVLGQTTARVVRTGFVGDQELVALYSGAECFLFPSFGEGFGFPVLEAMACGAPVIAGDTTSLPELVGDAGVLVPPENTAAMAEALCHVLGDREAAARLRAAGLIQARGYTWAACAQDTTAVYAELTG